MTTALRKRHRQLLSVWRANGAECCDTSILTRLDCQQNIIQSQLSGGSWSHGHVGTAHFEQNGRKVGGEFHNLYDFRTEGMLVSRYDRMRRAKAPFIIERPGLVGRSRGRWTQILCVPTVNKTTGEYGTVALTEWSEGPDRRQVIQALRRHVANKPYSPFRIAEMSMLIDRFSFSEILSYFSVFESNRHRIETVRLLDGIRAELEVERPLLRVV